MKRKIGFLLFLLVMIAGTILYRLSTRPPREAHPTPLDYTSWLEQQERIAARAEIYSKNIWFVKISSHSTLEYAKKVQAIRSRPQFLVDKTVKQIIAEQLGLDEAKVTNTASLVDDLKADSLGVIEIVMAMEEAFNVVILDEEAETLTTVGDVIEHVGKKCGQSMTDQPKPQIYAPNVPNPPFIISLGGNLSHQEAQQLRRKAICAGFPVDISVEYKHSDE